MIQSILSRSSYVISLVTILLTITVSMVSMTASYSPYKSGVKFIPADYSYPGSSSASDLSFPSSMVDISSPLASLPSSSSSPSSLIPFLPKRYSEFLGGPGKRVSEFLGGPGKRAFGGYLNGAGGMDTGKHIRVTNGYYLAKKLSEILSRNSNGPNVGPYRPGGSEFLGGPGKR